MPDYQPGQSGNKAGRPKGAKNKIPTKVRSIISQIVEEQAEQIRQDLAEMKPVERAKIWLALVEYTVPKLSRTEVVEEKVHESTPDYSTLSDDELQMLLELNRKISPSN